MYYGFNHNWKSQYCNNHQPQSSFSDVTECTMIEVTLNQEDHSYMFDDDDDESTTPVKACSESGNHHVTADQTIKKLDVPREAHSSVKRRRRMLQSFGSPDDVHVDISEYLNLPPEAETSEVKRPVTRSSPNVIFKGRKSFSRLASSVIYPFSFIKPCGVDGDMTLKDINQKILTPPAKPKENKAETPLIQTSAFSGKPVVGKTKIRTEGGKGSITVTRTRG
ncbi:hypothetical protein Bca52824_055140 [Brassica carinata]|uniref:Protein XRI1 n=1 Tax=Brassica carinata TaxID=52824 RepID=A0A8X7UL52_BRACI|nr:hypothetical protein Bca52824_055140 [Brassica carinata]